MSIDAIRKYLSETNEFDWNHAHNLLVELLAAYGALKEELESIKQEHRAQICDMAEQFRAVNVMEGLKAIDVNLPSIIAERDALKEENDRLRGDLQRCEADRKERIEQCDRMAEDWGDFCEAMGVNFDTQDAVAYKLRAKINNAEAEVKQLREAIQPAYMGLLVLKTMCRKAKLAGGVESTESAMRGLVEVMPELPALSALKGPTNAIL